MKQKLKIIIPTVLSLVVIIVAVIVITNNSTTTDPSGNQTQIENIESEYHNDYVNDLVNNLGMTEEEAEAILSKPLDGAMEALKEFSSQINYIEDPIVEMLEDDNPDDHLAPALTESGETIYIDTTVDDFFMDMTDEEAIDYQDQLLAELQADLALIQQALGEQVGTESFEDAQSEEMDDYGLSEEEKAAIDELKDINNTGWDGDPDTKPEPDADGNYIGYTDEDFELDENGNIISKSDSTDGN